MLNLGKNQLYIKMLLLLLLSVGIPVVILGYVSYNKSSEQLHLVMNALMMENAKASRDNLEKFMRDMDVYSQTFIASGRMKVFKRYPEEMSRADALSFVRDSLSIIDEMRSPYQLQIYPASEAQYKVLSEHTYPYASLHTHEQVTRAVAGKGTGFWDHGGNGELEYVRLIRELTQLTPLAVIHLKASASALQSVFVIPDQYPQIKHYILDRASRTVVYSPSSARDSFPDEVWTSAGGMLELFDDDFVAVSPVRLSNWSVVSIVPKAALLHPIKAMQQFSLWMVGIGLLVIALALGVITNRFVQPIYNLVGLMRKVHRGMLVPTSQDVTRGDEIGQLARGYNSMISGMNRLLETRRKMEEEKSRLEMQMLIHQINPHFLYNTLAAIKWRAEHVEEKKIAAMVASLSDLIRYSINNSEEYTTVEREIEHVKSYLGIELMRKEDAFRVFYHVQDKTHHLPILKLIAQPLAENAVKHAMYKLKSRQGKILVRVYADEGDLIISIEDNGGNFTPEAGEAYPVPHESNGVGLANVHHRIHSRFGSPYGVSLHDAGELGGCKAVLRHPILRS